MGEYELLEFWDIIATVLQIPWARSMKHPNWGIYGCVYIFVLNSGQHLSILCMCIYKYVSGWEILRINILLPAFLCS